MRSTIKSHSTPDWKARKEKLMRKVLRLTWKRFIFEVKQSWPPRETGSVSFSVGDGKGRRMVTSCSAQLGWEMRRERRGGDDGRVWLGPGYWQQHDVDIRHIKPRNPARQPINMLCVWLRHFLWVLSTFYYTPEYLAPSQCILLLKL